MIFILSHIALTFSMLLTAYMGFRFFKIGRKNTGYSMFILSIEFLIRNVFDFYSLFDSLYWILPEALLLSGIIIFTHGIIQKKAVKTVERKTYRQESKISSSLSIRNKLLIGLTIISISTILLFYIIGLYNMNSLDENLESVSINEINDIRRDFYDQEASDSKTMSTALEVIIRDNDIKKLYLEGDRDKLYEYTTPLFEGLKNKYGITHFYFILLDGECFVRIHNKNIYGDLIKRTTFENAKRTKEISSGIELGKTAFALRTVVPYYDEGKLIGYVELGEEIDHFLDNLKEYTNEHTPSSEFAIMVEKRYLDEGDWKSVRQVAGLRDNWNDIKDYVL
ncbi:MAG: hypothetical protein KKF44_03470, partial [Nanoarchaeota archaeon]|nr:hypothetical protein [Nanoarchaeota archaeon]